MPAQSRIPTSSPILGKIFALRAVLARQGTIVPTWRTHNGRRLGPYYRLVYYVQGRPRSIYLGRSEKLVRQVRRRLDKLQKPAKTKHALRAARKTVQAALRKEKEHLRAELAACGLTLRGLTVRGWRRWSRCKIFESLGLTNDLLPDFPVPSGSRTSDPDKI